MAANGTGKTRRNAKSGIIFFRGCLNSQKFGNVIPTAIGIPSGESGNLLFFKNSGFPFSRE